MSCVYRLAHARGAAALPAQREVPEERNAPALHIISMQDASTLTDRQLVKKERLIYGASSCIRRVQGI